MTTTELIELLKKYEFGGATGRPREVMFEVDDEIFKTDGVEITGSGDGLSTELFLSLPSTKRKTGKWIDKDGGLATCSECGDRWGVWSAMNYCPTCGVKMEAER